MNLQSFEIIKKSYYNDNISLILSIEEINTLCAAVNEDPSLLAWIYNSNDDIQIAAINSTSTKDYKDGRILQVIKNPSEKVQLIAVQKDGECIRYLRNPSEAVQLVAINQNKLAIRYIREPFQSVKNAAKIFVDK